MSFSGWAVGVSILASSVASPAAIAGGESSAGGADDYRVTPAFFIGAGDGRPVRACYQVASGFGIESSVLERMIKQAFAEWGAYIPRKRLDIVPNWPRIRTSIDLVSACAGDEELTFYFGVDNALIAKHRGQFAKPFGFAQLVREGRPEMVCSCPVEQPCSSCSGAQGFVWIAPPGFIDARARIPHWSSATQDALAGLLLHEIGHVFGNGHVDGTAMTEKIGRYLENDAAPSQSGARNVSRYSKIDADIELVPCMECRFAYTAAETFDPLAPPGQGSDWELTFGALMGHAPVPPLAIRYERLGSPPGSGKLTLMDATGLYSFAVNVVSQLPGRTDSTPLFYGQGGIDFRSFGVSYYGRVGTREGRLIDVAVSYNMMDETGRGRKAVILPLGGQEFYPRPIFVSAD